MSNLLTLIIFTPLVGGIAILFIPSARHRVFRVVALVSMLIQSAFTILMMIMFTGTPTGGSMIDSFQLIERYQWIQLDLGNIGRMNIDYFVGIDGISFPLVILSSLILTIGVISSWNQKQQAKGYFFLYLTLATSIIGCFLALDFFLFYLFFELMLLPMFFLIGIWGGPKRAYASMKFFLYTLIGSLLILVVMIGLYLSVLDPGTDSYTFNLLAMMDPGNYVSGSMLDPTGQAMLWGYSVRSLAFIALMVGFAIKLPAVPLHTWLPDAHVEAPTAISVILAGLLLKVGGYGFFRIAYSLFPDVAISGAMPIAIVGVFSIIYGGLNAMAQKDLKRLIAYSSVSHMGFVLLGLASLTVEGVSGSVFHMFSHGIISAALFLIAGVIYDRTHDRQIENYSGLASKLPGYTFVVVLVFFASLGLPGFSGFIGELMVLLGGFSSGKVNGLLSYWIPAIAVFGIIISAAYYLWTIQRMFFGKYWVRQEKWLMEMTDLSAREWIMFIPLIILILLLGIAPGLLLDGMNNSVNQFIDHVMNFTP